MMMANAGAAGISMRLGWRGPSEAICTACAAGTHAIAAAARLVASGRCDVAIGGGSEASMHPVALAAFSNMTALSSSGHSRPFDVRRDGFVMTEGACCPRARGLGPGRRPRGDDHAELAGQPAPPTRTTSPRPPRTAPARWPAWSWPWSTPTSGRPMWATSTRTGPLTPLNDLAEARAIAKVFGDPGPLVTSTKGVTGHGLAAAGAIEAVAAVLTIDRATISPTAGLRRAGPRDHDSDRARRARARGSRRRSSRIPSASAATTAAWSCCLLAETSR